MAPRDCLVPLVEEKCIVPALLENAHTTPAAASVKGTLP